MEKKRSLKGIRADLELTQRQMADKLGISEVSYRNVEKGNRDLLAKELEIIAKLANLKMEEINFDVHR